MLKSQPIRQSIIRPFLGLMLVFTGLFSVESCENIHSNQNDEIDTHEDYLIFQNHFFTVYELIEEIADLTTPQGLPEKWKSPMLPKGLKINKLDTTYLDGNGVEFEVDFGDWNTNIQQPVGPDGFYKSGKIKVIINKFYQEIGAEMKVEFGSSELFTFGNATNPMVWKGELEFKRLDFNSMNMVSSGLEILEDAHLNKVIVDLNLERITGMSTPGIFEDSYKLDGTITANMDSEDDLSIEMNTPLIKKVEWGCSSSPLKGILVIKSENDKNGNGVTVDFDPFNNEACDDWVRLQFAGKTKDYKIPMFP